MVTYRNQGNMQGREMCPPVGTVTSKASLVGFAVIRISYWGRKCELLWTDSAKMAPALPKGVGVVPCVQRRTSACSFSHKGMSTTSPSLQKIKLKDGSLFMQPATFRDPDFSPSLSNWIFPSVQSPWPDSELLMKLRDQSPTIPLPSISLLLCFFQGLLVSFLRD